MPQARASSFALGEARKEKYAFFSQYGVTIRLKANPTKVFEPLKPTC